MLKGELYWGIVAILGGCAAIQGAVMMALGTSFLMGALIMVCGLALLGSGSLGCARLESPEPDLDVVITVTTLAYACFFGIAVVGLI